MHMCMCVYIYRDTGMHLSYKDVHTQECKNYKKI